MIIPDLERLQTTSDLTGKIKHNKNTDLSLHYRHFTIYLHTAMSVPNGAVLFSLD